MDHGDLRLPQLGILSRHTGVGAGGIGESRAEPVLETDIVHSGPESNPLEGCNKTPFSLQSNTEQRTGESSIHNRSGYLIYLVEWKRRMQYGHREGFTDGCHRRWDRRIIIRSWQRGRSCPTARRSNVLHMTPFIGTQWLCAYLRGELELPSGEEMECSIETVRAWKRANIKFENAGASSGTSMFCSRNWKSRLIANFPTRLPSYSADMKHPITREFTRTTNAQKQSGPRP
jgi:hypothetical protein